MAVVRLLLRFCTSLPTAEERGGRWIRPEGPTEPCVPVPALQFPLPNSLLLVRHPGKRYPNESHPHPQA